MRSALIRALPEQKRKRKNCACDKTVEHVASLCQQSERACDELSKDRLNHGRQSARDVWSDGCIESTIHSKNPCASLQSATQLRCASKQSSPIAAMLSLRNISSSSQYIACEDCFRMSATKAWYSTTMHAPLRCSPLPRSRCKSQGNPHPAGRRHRVAETRNTADAMLCSTFPILSWRSRRMSIAKSNGMPHG